jgi:hypothetical protein
MLINKLMGGSWTIKGFLLMWNVEEQFQIGDLVDLVVDLEQPGLVVMKSTSETPAENSSSQADKLGLRNQE